MTSAELREIKAAHGWDNAYLAMISGYSPRAIQRCCSAEGTKMHRSLSVPAERRILTAHRGEKLFIDAIDEKLTAHHEKKQNRTVNLMYEKCGPWGLSPEALSRVEEYYKTL